jgi:hypothetical protein
MSEEKPDPPSLPQLPFGLDPKKLAKVGARHHLLLSAKVFTT